MRGVRESAGLVRVEGYDKTPMLTVGHVRERIDHFRREADRIAEAFVLVPRYDIEVSAGNGAEPPPEFSDTALSFRRDWLQNLGVRPEDARILINVGDSMEPGLRHSDTVLIDSGRREIVSDGVYAFRLDAQLYLKRLQRVPHGVAVHSDNVTKYPPFTVSADDMTERDFKLIGRMRWFGREV